MSTAEHIEVIDEVRVTKVTDTAGDEVVVVEEEVAVVDEVERHDQVEVSVERYGESEHRREHFHVSREAALLHVLDEGARKLDFKLLPNSEDPLDQLRAVYQDHEVGEPLDLALTLAEFLKKPPLTHHFAVELVRAIRINTRWRVAPKEEMTPKAILELAGLSPTEFSLYHPVTSKVPLPPDMPVKVHRGEHFEAQRDGKYG